MEAGIVFRLIGVNRRNRWDLNPASLKPPKDSEISQVCQAFSNLPKGNMQPFRRRQ